MDALGDEWFCLLYISPAGFPNVLPTTWAELTSKGILQDRDLNDETYELTPFGYLMALRVSGRSDERQFREKLGKFCKVLKGSLKRRNDIGRIAFQELVAESGVSEAFASNVLDADLILHILGKIGVAWDGEHLVKVPNDFGLVPM
jgi:hypothetical protein